MTLRCVCEQRRLQQDWAVEQACQSLRCSPFCSVENSHEMAQIWKFSFQMELSFNIGISMRNIQVCRKWFLLRKCITRSQYKSMFRPLLKSAVQKIIFLFLNQNICCGYSKETSQ